MNAFSFLVGTFFGCLLGVLALGLAQAGQTSSAEPPVPQSIQSEPQPESRVAGSAQQST